MRMFRPRAISPPSVEAPSAMTSPPLVQAGALVAPLELGHLVLVGHARGGGDDHLGGGHVAHHAVLLGEDHDAGVGSRLVLHAGGHHGGLGLQEGHGLPLHVGAHEGPVGVVVLQEGDHGRGHGHQLLGRHVQIVDLGVADLDDLVQLPGHHTVLLEPVGLGVHGLVGLGHDGAVLFVGGQVDDLLGDLLVGLVHHPVGGLDEAVLVDPGIGGQGVDQADVGTFRGLDGAHTAVVGVRSRFKPPGPRAERRRLWVSSDRGLV